MLTVAWTKVVQVCGAAQRTPTDILGRMCTGSGMKGKSSVHAARFWVCGGSMATVGMPGIEANWARRYFSAAALRAAGSCQAWAACAGAAWAWLGRGKTADAIRQAPKTSPAHPVGGARRRRLSQGRARMRSMAEIVKAHAVAQERN